MKLNKKIKGGLLAAVIAFTLIECKKDSLEKQVDEAPTSTSSTLNYSSIADFYLNNGAPLQSFTFDVAVGGTFTTPQGTIVSIPANAFEAKGGISITGDISIGFKDIYTKSDMVLSNMPTQTSTGLLLSAGEFYINASTANGDSVFIAPWTSIKIELPAKGIPVDYSMVPFGFNADSLVWQPNGWTPTSLPDTVAPTLDTLSFGPESYVYEVFRLQPWVWHNCDYQFSGSITNLSVNIMGLDSINSQTNMKMVFTDINSVVNISKNFFSGKFEYPYAPIGEKCTIVTISIRDEKMFTSFTPITIGANQTINVELSETTTEAFKIALEALN